MLLILFNQSASGVSPPAAPSDLTALTIAADKIDLFWVDHASDEDGFTVERSTDNVIFVQIGSTGPNVVVYHDTGLTAGTTYYYRVRAFNGAGNSAYSNTVNATTNHGRAPAYAVDEATILAGLAGESIRQWAKQRFNKKAAYDKLDESKKRLARTPRTFHFGGTARRGLSAPAVFSYAAARRPKEFVWPGPASRGLTAPAEFAYAAATVTVWPSSTISGRRGHGKFVFMDVKRMRQEDDQFLATVMLAVAVLE